MGKQLVGAARPGINGHLAERVCSAMQDRGSCRKQGKKGHEIHHKADLAFADPHKHESGKETCRDALVPTIGTTKWREISPTSGERDTKLRTTRRL